MRNLGARKEARSLLEPLGDGAVGVLPKDAGKVSDGRREAALFVDGTGHVVLARDAVAEGNVKVVLAKGRRLVDEARAGVARHVGIRDDGKGGGDGGLARGKVVKDGLVGEALEGAARQTCDAGGVGDATGLEHGLGEGLCDHVRLSPGGRGVKAIL